MRLAARFLGAVIALAVTLWLAVSVIASDHERRAAIDYPPEGQFVDVDGQRVHVLVAGVKSGPDLVLIHGASGHLRDMQIALLDPLKDRYRLLIFDRPGMGYSDALPGSDGGSLNAQADLLQAAAEQLGAIRPIVLGQSYGGAVALDWAVHHPDRLAGLVVVSGVAFPWKKDLPRRYLIGANRLIGPLLTPLYTAFLSDGRIDHILGHVFAPQKVPEGYRDAFGARLSLRRTAVLTNARQRAHLKAELAQLAPHYPEINVPVAIVHGTADQIVPYQAQGERLAQTIPGAALFALNGIGHMPHHVATDAVIEAVDSVAARAGLQLTK